MPRCAIARSPTSSCAFTRPARPTNRIYRHILANLDDAHIKKDPAALRQLEKKGHVMSRGMTKAASYLLTFDDFSKMRQYVIDHVDWMGVGLEPACRRAPRHAGRLRVRDARRVSHLEHGGRRVGRADALKRCLPSSPSACSISASAIPTGRQHSGHLIIMTRKI